MVNKHKTSIAGHTLLKNVVLNLIASRVQRSLWDKIS